MQKKTQQKKACIGYSRQVCDESRKHRSGKQIGRPRSLKMHSVR